MSVGGFEKIAPQVIRQPGHGGIEKIDEMLIEHFGVVRIDAQRGRSGAQIGLAYPRIADRAPVVLKSRRVFIVGRTQSLENRLDKLVEASFQGEGLETD